jgi:hypothetical protein
MKMFFKNSINVKIYIRDNPIMKRKGFNGHYTDFRGNRITKRWETDLENFENTNYYLIREEIESMLRR